MDRHQTLLALAAVAVALISSSPPGALALARPTTGPYSALAVGDTTVSRMFEVRVDTAMGVPFAYSQAHSRSFEARVDTSLGVPFAYSQAHSRLFIARVDTLYEPVFTYHQAHSRSFEVRVDSSLGVSFAYRASYSRLFELRHADAWVPWAYHQAYSSAFHAFGQLLPAAVGDVPLVFAFHPPSPNPAHAGALLRFDLPSARKVSVDVLDVMGRRVRTLADRAAYAPGRWSLRLDRGRLPSGLYWVRFNAGEFKDTRRLVMVE